MDHNLQFFNDTIISSVSDSHTQAIIDLQRNNSSPIGQQQIFHLTTTHIPSDNNIFSRLTAYSSIPAANETIFFLSINHCLMHKLCNTTFQALQLFPIWQQRNHLSVTKIIVHLTTTSVTYTFPILPSTYPSVTVTIIPLSLTQPFMLHQNHLPTKLTDWCNNYCGPQHSLIPNHGCGPQHTLPFDTTT